MPLLSPSRPRAGRITPIVATPAIRQPRQPPPEEHHGLRVIAGVTGSGKTLLACHFAYEYAGARCTRCEPDCGKRWTVFSHLKSTRHWAKSFDLSAGLAAGDDAYDHGVVILDEAYLLAERRRFMRSENLVMDYAIRQTRKRNTIVIMTAQDVDTLDGRIYKQARRVYRVWTYDRGVHVWSDTYTTARGDMPPEQLWRSRIPRREWWYTAHSRSLYDTWEIVDQPSHTRVPDQRVRVAGADGNSKVVTVGTLVGAVISWMVVEGWRTATVDRIAEAIATMWPGLQLPPGALSQVLESQGLIRDMEGRYLLSVEAVVS